MSENKVNERSLTGINLSVSKRLKRKPWPKECVWPEPLAYGEGQTWDEDLLPDPDALDEAAHDLLDAKEYFDSLVKDGRLNEDYSLNYDYEPEDDWDKENADISDCDSKEDGEENWDDPENFEPKMGEEFWDEEKQQFQLDWWEDELNDRLNLLKIDYDPFDKDPAMFVRDTIGYEFINENLLRQAFTRRAFAVEYGLPGCNEELEFLGDTVLNTVVTREMLYRLAQVNEYRTSAPFEVRFQEGGLTKIRSRFVSKDYLAQRASELGLDKLILYGTGEEPTESSREDMMEALIGAVTVDCNWNWDVIAGVVDRLICVQIDKPDLFLKASYYEIFNAWHQRRFGTMPEYELHGYRERFDCTLRFRVPANDKGIAERQRVDVYSSTRSEAREQAAWDAYRFVRNNGLWINLKDFGLTPDKENSINQLQELYQKKYLEQLPEYEFEEQEHDEWYCMCRCCGICGTGQAGSKVKAKKEAAYMALGLLFSSAGIKEKR